MMLNTCQNVLKKGFAGPFWVGFVLLLGMVLGCAGCRVEKENARPYTIHTLESKVEGVCKPWEKTAAKILEESLGAFVSEGKLTVDGKDLIVFHVGDDDFVRSKGLSSETLADEQWVVKSFGRDVVINGGGRHGVIYAVSHFLEDACGVRFWNDYDTQYPAVGPVALMVLDLKGRPSFAYRDIYRGGSTNATPRFAIMRCLNRNGDSKVPQELGGEVNYGPPYHCHTFDLYVPWSKYGKEHPEYFSLRDGKRVGGRTKAQLCLSNARVRELLKEGLLGSIAAGEAAAKKSGLPPPRFYDLSQNDADAPCQCAACKAAAEKYEHSGFYLNVINEIADEVAKKYPHVFITTLAYNYTEPPPKGGVKPRDNVVVKLCDTRSNQALSLADECNKEFRTFLESWGKVAKHLLIWDYAAVYINPAVLFPFASEFTLAETYRLFRTNHVMGVFIEHPGMTNYDMYDLKYYLESKLFENPDLDNEALIEDFMTCYFGAASEPILKARRHLYAIAKARKPFITFFPPTEKFDYVTRADLEKMASLWNEAEQLAQKDARILKRVKRARLSQDALMRFRMSEPHKEGNKFVLKAEALDFKAGVGTRIEKCSNVRMFECSNEKCSNVRMFECLNEKGVLRSRPLPEDGVGSAGAPRTPRWKGEVCRVAVDKYRPGAFGPPIKWGMYDRPSGKNLSSGAFADVEAIQKHAAGYDWYDVGEVEIPPTGNNVFYLGGDWTLHFCISYPGMNGKKFQLRVLAKFEGPRFRPGSKGDNVISIARLEFQAK